MFIDRQETLVSRAMKPTLCRAEDVTLVRMDEVTVSCLLPWGKPPRVRQLGI